MSLIAPIVGSQPKSPDFFLYHGEYQHVSPLLSRLRVMASVSKKHKIS